MINKLYFALLLVELCYFLGVHGEDRLKGWPCRGLCRFNDKSKRNAYLRPSNFQKEEKKTPESSAAQPHKCMMMDIASIRGWLIDLDGTVYKPGSLLPGASEFFDWLALTRRNETNRDDFLLHANTSRQHSFVLLTNSVKAQAGVISKLSYDPYRLNISINPDEVYSAGLALADYLEKSAPPQSKIFAIGSATRYADGSQDTLYRILKRYVDPNRFSSWDVRTNLILSEVYEWAALAQGGFPVFVALGIDNDASDIFADDPLITGRPGYLTLDFELLSKMTLLLRNGAMFAVSSPDAIDTVASDPKHPTVDLSLPSIGAVESYLLTASEMMTAAAGSKNRHINTGKGGNGGSEFMMEPALSLLRRQDPTLDLSNVVMIGDNLGTDIKAGNHFGAKTILVLSGAHGLEDLALFPGVKPTCWVTDLGDIPKLFNSEDRIY